MQLTSDLAWELACGGPFPMADYLQDPDEGPMTLAIRQAMTGVGLSSPNPPVGCVLQKDGRILGVGAHALWTGRAMLSFNSLVTDAKAGFGSAAVWDPSTDQWTELPRAPRAGDEEPAAVWTGHELLVWGELYGLRFGR